MCDTGEYRGDSSPEEEILAERSCATDYLVRHLCLTPSDRSHPCLSGVDSMPEYNGKGGRESQGGGGAFL